MRLLPGVPRQGTLACMGNDEQDTLPPDPVTPVQGSAASIHELFESWVTAGFTRNEALWLTGLILVNGARGTMPEPPAQS